MIAFLASGLSAHYAQVGSRGGDRAMLWLSLGVMLAAIALSRLPTARS
ncbi:hypothetical protein [Pseudomonas sp. BN102]|nr:hypothetical protein [Pseudomonas sp. BN102]